MMRSLLPGLDRTRLPPSAEMCSVRQRPESGSVPSSVACSEAPRVRRPRTLQWRLPRVAKKVLRRARLGAGGSSSERGSAGGGRVGSGGETVPMIRPSILIWRFFRVVDHPATVLRCGIAAVLFTFDPFTAAHAQRVEAVPIGKFLSP